MHDHTTAVCMRKIAVSRFAEHSSRERTTSRNTLRARKAAARAKRRKKKQTVHKLELIATHDRANDDQEHSRFAAGRYCDVCAHGGRFRERYISALLVVSAKGSPAGLREASGSAILSAIRNIDSLVPSVLYPGILAGDKSFVNVRSQSRAASSSPCRRRRCSSVLGSAASSFIVISLLVVFDRLRHGEILLRASHPFPAVRQRL